MPHLTDLADVQIEMEALDAVPESIARWNCVLPVRLEQSSLHVILPVDSEILDTIEKLRLLLNLSATFDTCARAAIEAALDKYYPTPREQAERVVLPDALPPLKDRAEFPFLDFTGVLEFSTASSISFQLVRKACYLEYSDGRRTYLGKDRVHNVVGWLDAHYPCNGFHKLQVRCSLPGDYLAFEPMRDLIRQVCQVLRLPEKVPYRIQLEAAGMSTSREDPLEGFVCTTKWLPPGDSE